MNRSEKIKRVTEILSPYNLYNADRAVAEHIIDSLVSEDEVQWVYDGSGDACPSGWKERTETDTEIAKQMITRFQQHLWGIFKSNIPDDYRHVLSQLKNWLDKEGK